MEILILSRAVKRGPDRAPRTRNLYAMSFKALLDNWLGERSPELSEERYSIHLCRWRRSRCSRGCRFCAAGFIYRPPRLWPPEKIIADLLHAGLDEIEAAMPYVPGSKIIREDEFGDPVYEDVGMTPRFLDLVKTFRKKMGTR